MAVSKGEAPTAAIPAPLTREIMQLKVQLAEAQHQRARVEAELASCRAQGKRVAADNKRMRAYITWERGVLANREMAAGDKITLIALRGEHEHAAQVAGVDPAPRDKDPEPQPILMQRIAERTGCSPDSAGDRLKLLAKAGAVTRVEKHPIGSNGQRVTRIHAAPTLLALTEPEKIAFPVEEKPNRGGKRVPLTCMDCGSTQLREEIHRRIVCETCGHVEEKPVEISMVNVECDLREPETDDDTTPDASHKAGISPDRQLDGLDDPPPAPTPTPASTPEPDPRYIGQPWYDAAAPDEPLSQALAWACLYDVRQATLWYGSERLQDRWRRNVSIITLISSNGPLSPTAFIEWLYARYGDRDLDKLREVAHVLSVDSGRVSLPRIDTDEVESAGTP